MNSITIIIDDRGQTPIEWPIEEDEEDEEDY